MESNLIILGFSGLSESGKNYAGSYYAQKYNIKQVNLAEHVEKIRMQFLPELTPDQFHDFLYDGDSTFARYYLVKIWEDVIQSYQSENIITIESLVHPLLGKVLKMIHKNTLIIYFDTKFHIRCIREAKKNGKSLANVMNETFEKDRIKLLAGVEQYQQIADIVYNNSSTNEKFELFLDMTLMDLM